ncbi:hypothetical protein [Blastococcus sp. SYSU DS0617]
MWPYFSLDLLGLTKGGAERLLATARQENLALSGSIIDPEQWWSTNMDRATVEPLVHAWEVALQTGSLTSDEAEVVRLMLGSAREWLADSRT